MMDFYEVLDKTIDLLRSRKWVTYRVLKRQFNLDDELLEDLKEELIYGQQVAVDEDGRVLVWTGEAGTQSNEVWLPQRQHPLHRHLNYLTGTRVPTHRRILPQRS